MFDFGGGTLDVTVVDAFANMVEIADISGDNCLGGKDFNEAIAMDMCRKLPSVRSPGVPTTGG